MSRGEQVMSGRINEWPESRAILGSEAEGHGGVAELDDRDLGGQALSAE